MGVWEGVVNDGVKGTGPSGGGHSRESWHQTGKDKELLFSRVVPQGLQPQQEETDPLTADLDGRRLRHINGNIKEPNINKQLAQKYVESFFYVKYDLASSHILHVSIHKAIIVFTRW